MHYPHGVLGHDGYSLDGQQYLAGDTVTVVDGGESDNRRDAVPVLNSRSGSHMLISPVSVSWFTSLAGYTPGPHNLDQFLSLQWNQRTAPKQTTDFDDFSDGSLSAGQSSSSISSPTTPLTSLNPLFVVRRDSAVDVSSPEGAQGKKDVGFDDVLGITAARSGAHHHPCYAPFGQSIPASPTGLPTHDLQVNFMYIPSSHDSQQSTQSPATQGSPNNQSNPRWSSFDSAPDASWQDSPARPGALAPEMTGHIGYHQHGQQASGSDFARATHHHSHPPQFTVPQYGPPEQGSFDSQSYGANMQHIAAHHTGPVFYRTQDHQTMALSTPGTQYYSPSLQPYSGRPTRIPAATTSRAADPEPPAPKEFRPDLVLDAFRHQVRPHIDVLGVQRAQRNASEDQSGAERISEALRLAQSTVDDTIGVLETLRPSSTVGHRTNKRLREEHVEHILAGIQCVRQSALDGRELAAKDRENLTKQLESLRNFVKTLERIDKTIVVPSARNGRSALPTDNSSQDATAGRTVPESNEPAQARPTGATTGMTSCHWVEGQTTPPPDQPSVMAIHYGQHDAMRQQIASSAVHARQAVPEPGMHVTGPPPLMLSNATTSPGLESSGCHLEPAPSTLASSVMASTLASAGVPSPMPVPGWTSQLHPVPSLSPQHHPEPGHMGPALYPSPPQAGYNAPLPTHLAAHSPAGPSPVQASAGMPLPVYGSTIVQSSPYVGPTPGSGSSPDGLLLPGPVMMMPSVSAPGTFAVHADPRLSVSSPMDSGRRGSVPERRLPHRDRNRAAPYPMEYRSFGGRKGSV